MYDQFEDRRVGLRFCTFVTPVQDLGNGCKVMPKCIPLPCPCFTCAEATGTASRGSFSGVSVLLR